METYSIITPPPSVVPLPSSAILFGTALLGLGAMRRRRRKLKAAV
ncbi:MAG: VPLPA-CTERM sorting domain-containing protein [Rhodospirillaceae bacterium]|nr:VPLPA-CTERM sorting domain-containing protein [Rhodospirillaceae bacterium]MBT5526435.1 VPLPA-CTERM sorting domain-containing protein [Rhodospirillaceae bacterium]MBT5880486.1 VPLPA-CTERM sorting domain-containing protein [Rhodospirillaceae bacterium]MBT6909753.1 VPLPA-CTERM sorting domain-containing protein [Rhodospirillaceae bacterium]MBT7284404.1 VPLPA-CTERM sorting domain-containing protein [Rhodospirillaceae bacterium]